MATNNLWPPESKNALISAHRSGSTTNEVSKVTETVYWSGDIVWMLLSRIWTPKHKEIYISVLGMPQIHV